MTTTQARPAGNILMVVAPSYGGDLGLPAVVGCRGACELIPEGRTIRIDGASGLVEMIP